MIDAQKTFTHKSKETDITITVSIKGDFAHHAGEDTMLLLTKAILDTAKAFKVEDHIYLCVAHLRNRIDTLKEI